jgi:hypothetical protein
MTRWCAKCARMVPQHHMHGGLADYVRKDDQWACIWCRAALASNDVLCNCAGAKKARNE